MTKSLGRRGKDGRDVLVTVAVHIRGKMPKTWVTAVRRVTDEISEVAYDVVDIFEAGEKTRFGEVAR